MSLTVRLQPPWLETWNAVYGEFKTTVYDVRNVIIFWNPRLKSHQSYYPHQVWEAVNFYLLTTFQLNNMLRLNIVSRGVSSINYGLKKEAQLISE